MASKLTNWEIDIVKEGESPRNHSKIEAVETTKSADRGEEMTPEEDPTVEAPEVKPAKVVKTAKATKKKATKNTAKSQ